MLQVVRSVISTGLACVDLSTRQKRFNTPLRPSFPSIHIQSPDRVGPTSLARAGRMHDSVVAANMRAMVPVVLEYGYPSRDVKEVVEGTLADVSSG